MTYIDLPAGSRSLRLTLDEESDVCLAAVRTVQELELGHHETNVLKNQLIEVLSSRQYLESCGRIDGVAVAFVCMLGGHTTIYAARGTDSVTLFFQEKAGRILDRLVLSEFECERWLYKLRNFHPSPDQP